MRRRITIAIVGVTAFVLVVLGIPLAIVAQHAIIDSEVVELQATVAHLLTEINLPIDADALERLATEPDAPPPFGIYDTSGRLIYGVGPEFGDGAVRAARDGSTATSRQGAIVVAAPLVDRKEQLLAVVRIGESLSGPKSVARQAWLVMLLAGAIALALAWVLARQVAGKLSRPLSDLAVSAASLGGGGVLPDHVQSGIGEIDLLGVALTASSRRINDALGRERRFSADVSHQLRTPLTGLRLRLEHVTSADDARSVVVESLRHLDRLEQTVDHLLAFARNAMPTTSSCPLDQVTDAAVARWAARCASESRLISASTESSAVVRISGASLDQILDVLIDNALQHGSGAIDVTTKRLTGGAAVDVCDEGSSSGTGTDDELFRRGVGANHGIGLALARSIADAEGGRLIIANREPTTFSLILLAVEDT